MDYSSYTGYKGADPNKIREELRDGFSRMKTESLFEETMQDPTRENGYIPLYSLREYENTGLPSAYRIYMASIDEADAAQKLVGSYQHWRKLCSLKWFINGRPEIGFEGLARWRQDMAERDKTLAKASLMDQVVEGNVTAARALYKLAQEDEKEANKILPRRGVKAKSSEDDSIVEFLNKYKEK